MSRYRKAVILGATGPTGIHLAKALEKRVDTVRVASRNLPNLEQLFPGDRFERMRADALVAEQALDAVTECELVFDCIGLPAHLMERHPDVAANVAEALRKTGARSLQVSSYWPYMPVQKLPLDESHPRQDGPRWAALRRESEDILQQAGATVLHLPDFFGAHVHTSTLQNALNEAVQGVPMNWIGSRETEHDFIYVPDAMRVAAELSEKDEAAGERYIVPGSGPLTGARLAEIASDALGRNVKLRAAGPALLWIVSLFNSDLRGFMPMVPEYAKPHAYDGSKLEALLGKPKRTGYPEALKQTLDWIASKR